VGARGLECSAHHAGSVSLWQVTIDPSTSAEVALKQHVAAQSASHLTQIPIKEQLAAPASGDAEEEERLKAEMQTQRIAKLSILDGSLQVNSSWLLPDNARIVITKFEALVLIL
jgi:hypothetical protein